MTPLNNELLSVLKGIGLSKNEAIIYLTCLELGPASIWDIAQQSGMKRPTCYVILDELIEKGHASSTNDGKRTIFSVSSPKQLLLAVERRHARFLNHLAQFDGLASKSPQKPIIRLYEGTPGVMEAYNLSLDQPKDSEILIYGTAMVEIAYKTFIPDYIKARVRKKLSVRAILPDTPLNRAVAARDIAELRQTRFLPEGQFSPSTETNIFGNTIAYIAHSENKPFATVIESMSLSEIEKQRFELLWGISQ